jgi:hypothetical protein
MKSSHDAYRNLHTNTWSLLSRATGRIEAHPTEIIMADPKLVVQPAGVKRVRAEKRKHVHAYVRGRALSDTECKSFNLADYTWTRITYNPYKHTTFVYAEQNEPIHAALFIHLREDGTAWATK